MDFKTFHSKLKKLDVDLELKKAVELTKHHAIDLNKEQLSESTDSKNKPLRPYKNRSYQLFKGRINANLFLEGDFYNKFFGDVFRAKKGVTLDIDSTDKKRDWLIEGTSRMEPFGDDVFGLTTGNKNDWQDKKVKKELTTFIKKAIGIS